jgi:spoIIIJ-associated protein
MKKEVQKQLDTLLKLMGVDTKYEIEEEKVSDITYIKVCFQGDNLGYLIGGHGKHLDSLQYVLGLMMRKEFGEDGKYRVLLDVCDYRKERDEKLEKFAMQKADDARILGEPVDLPPMKASDRRVVHVVLEKFDDIKTESIGEDRDRHIRIIPVSDSDILEESSEESEEDSEE